MPRYFVSKELQINGEHEVHREDCSLIPEKENCIFLGNYMSSETAVGVAENFYDNVQSCYQCGNGAAILKD